MNSWQKAKRDNDIAYEQGLFAASRQEPLDKCRYRQIEKRSAWVRGWHAYHDQTERVSLSPEQKHKGLQQIAKLRQLMGQHRVGPAIRCKTGNPT